MIIVIAFEEKDEYRNKPDSDILSVSSSSDMT